MRLAYFTNQYPKVSHSFIRREILALEQLGYSVERFALKSDKSELVDPLDQDEFIKTVHLLSEPKMRMVWACLAVLFSRPFKLCSALSVTVRMGLRSDRGLLRHFAYLLESCVLLRRLKQGGIRHVHVHFGTNSTAVAMFAHLLGGPSYSFTVHGPEEFDKPEFISLSEKVRHSRFVAAISAYGRSQLYRWIPAEQWYKVKVVHCGLDEVFLSGNEKLTPNFSNRLVCVGRLCEQKGQLLLLDALKSLLESGVDCKLVLAGDGPMRKDIERRIAEYGLADRVEITGWISSDRVKHLLIDSRGLVLPSFAEGLPVVIMEAMALKRPVVSTYVAGIPELVKSGENGWLVPAGEVEQLSDAMRQLLEADAETLNAMGVKAHQAVAKAHDVNREAEKLAQYFREAIENGSD